MEATTSSITGNDWVNLKSLIQTLEQAGSTFRRIQDILVEFLQLVEEYKRLEDRPDDYETMKQELETCFQCLNENFAEPTRLKVTESVKGLCRDIKIELAHIREHSIIQPTAEHAERVASSANVLVHYRRTQVLFHGLLLNTDSSTWAVPDQDELRSLALASRGCSSAPATERDSCVSSTEVRRFRSWMQDNPHGAVFWAPYTRQTGIGRSLCAELDATHKLGANCFLSPEGCGLNSIITSIAVQLANYSVPFRAALSSSHPWSFSESLEVQFEELIAKPLTRVQASLPGDLAVIIDTMDEPGSVHPILNTFLAGSKDLPVKFVVFTRPEPYHGPVDRLFVREVGSGCIIEEVERELEAALEPLGLSELQIADFVQRTGALFVFAAVAAHYIGDDNWSNSSIPPQSAQT